MHNSRAPFCYLVGSEESWRFFDGRENLILIVSESGVLSNDLGRAGVRLRLHKVTIRCFDSSLSMPITIGLTLARLESTGGFGTLSAGASN